MKKLVVDLDNTISFTVKGEYSSAQPHKALIAQLQEYQAQGFEIIIQTARNMRTYEGNVGKINANTLPIIIKWLNEHNVPYDEIHVGKPWCGNEGFYVDDRAIRPSEFNSMSFQQINELLNKEKICF
jgi:capsule biosynthesis phosphatase